MQETITKIAKINNYSYIIFFYHAPRAIFITNHPPLQHPTLFSIDKDPVWIYNYRIIQNLKTKDEIYVLFRGFCRPVQHI